MVVDDFHNATALVPVVTSILFIRTLFWIVNGGVAVLMYKAALVFDAEAATPVK